MEIGADESASPGAAVARSPNVANDERRSGGGVHPLGASLRLSAFDPWWRQDDAASVCGSGSRTLKKVLAKTWGVRGGGPILKAGIAAMGESGVPPPRTVIANPSRPSGRERSHNLGRKHQRVSSIRRRDASVLLRARRR